MGVILTIALAKHVPSSFYSACGDINNECECIFFFQPNGKEDEGLFYDRQEGGRGAASD